MIKYLLACLVMTVSLAKKTYKLEQKPRVELPKVEASTFASSTCILDDGLNHLCIDTSATVKVGWSFS